MPDRSADLHLLLFEKRREWTTMLLARQPELRQPLSKALQLLEMGRVAKSRITSTYRVRGNPHDYAVNVAQRTCSCGTPWCEHFLAAWFAFSEEEIVREQRTASYTREARTDHLHHGRWQGPHLHICDDGYCETTVYGTGEYTECARCRTPYCAVCDDTRF